LWRSSTASDVVLGLFSRFSAEGGGTAGASGHFPHPLPSRRSRDPKNLFPPVAVEERANAASFFSLVCASIKEIAFFPFPPILPQFEVFKLLFFSVVVNAPIRLALFPPPLFITALFFDPEIGAFFFPLSSYRRGRLASPPQHPFCGQNLVFPFLGPGPNAR